MYIEMAVVLVGSVCMCLSDAGAVIGCYLVGMGLSVLHLLCLFAQLRTFQAPQVKTLGPQERQDHWGGH